MFVGKENESILGLHSYSIPQTLLNVETIDSYYFFQIKLLVETAKAHT